MAINLRQRVPGTDAQDAGNYSSVILHDVESAASPAAIRRCLTGGPPFKREKGRPLPGFLQTIASTKVAMITNWAFAQFDAELALCDAAGVNNVPIELHLPILIPKEIAFPIAVVFKPCAGKLGMISGGAPQCLSHDGLLAAGAPLGEQISEEMFPLE